MKIHNLSSQCFFILLLAGCANLGHVWHRDNTTEAEFNQDRYQCTVEATRAYPAQNIPITTGGGYQTPVQTNCVSVGNNVNCTSYGGERVAPTTTWIDANAGNQSAMVEQCLKARGYSLGPRNQGRVERDIPKYNLECTVSCKNSGEEIEVCRSRCRE